MSQSSTPDLLGTLLAAIQSARPDLLSDGQPDLAKLKAALKPHYGLIWEDQPEHEVDVKEREGLLPLLALRADDSLLTNTKAPVHTLIQGDNYHALKVLNYTHRNKIDAIYIDPPYNTGNKDFRYNDRFVEKDDGFRHSKWLSFMAKRLHLAKALLKDTGVLFISIDENERAALELLCTEEIRFRYLGEIIWDKRHQKGNSAAISTSHEHILVFANHGFTEFNKVPKPNAEEMLRVAKRLVKQRKDLALAQKEFKAWLRQTNIPKAESAYDTMELSENGEVRLYQGTSLESPGSGGYDYPIRHKKTGKPCSMPSNGWRMPVSTFKKWDAEGRIRYGADESTQPRRKTYLDENMSEKVRSIFVHTKGGVTDLRELNCGLADKFPYPKPLGLLKHLLGLLPKDITVLDFFAGSGTTAHAVMQMNAEDDGTRQCLLVTNDEGEFKQNGKILPGGICTHVTLPRLARVIRGYKNDKGQPVPGSQENLLFMETTMYEPARKRRGPYIEHKRFLIEAVDLLRFKEGALVEEKPYHKGRKTTWDRDQPWGVYATLDGALRLVVLLDEDYLEECVEFIADLPGNVALYPFTYDDDTSAQQLCQPLTNVRVHPVPGNLLTTYRRLMRK